MTTYVEDYYEDGTPKLHPNGRHVWVDKNLREFGPSHQRDNTRASAAHMVMGDIDDYQSTITGERIHGRAHHRAHLKKHNCIEMGNESIESTQNHFETPNLSKKERLNDIRHAYDKLAANG